MCGGSWTMKCWRDGDYIQSSADKPLQIGLIIADTSTADVVRSCWEQSLDGRRWKQKKTIRQYTVWTLNQHKCVHMLSFIYIYTHMIYIYIVFTAPPLILSGLKYYTMNSNTPQIDRRPLRMNRAFVNVFTSHVAESRFHFVSRWLCMSIPPLKPPTTDT